MHTSSELVCASFRRTCIDSSLQLQVEVEVEVGKRSTKLVVGLPVNDGPVVDIRFRLSD